MKHALQVSITRKIGTADVNLTLTAERMLDSEKGMPEFDNLMSNAELYFEHFIEHWLPKMGKPVPNENATTQLLDALEICVTMKAGKRYWTVKTPQYNEHGIQFWPEHMKASGINPKQIPDEGHKCKEGTKAVIEYVDGKPKRVLKLIRE